MSEEDIVTIYQGGYVADLGVVVNPKASFFGWLMFKHPDGQWVSLANLTSICEALVPIKTEQLEQLTETDMADKMIEKFGPQEAGKLYGEGYEKAANIDLQIRAFIDLCDGSFEGMQEIIKLARTVETTCMLVQEEYQENMRRHLSNG